MPFGATLAMLALAALVGTVTGTDVVDPGLWSVATVVGWGVLLIGLGSTRVARRFAVEVTGPATATTGEDVTYRATVTGTRSPVAIRLLDPTGSWAVAYPDVPVELVRRADRRGVLTGVRIEVRVSGPPGVVVRSRSRVVPLDAELVVGPRPVRVGRLALASPMVGVVAERSAATTALGDVVRSVRPYAPGDPAHLVHWPSTARRGELVVRDLEPPVARRVAVLVDLRDRRVDAEPLCSLAAGLAQAALADGCQVVLATCVEGRPVSTPVRTPAAAGRILARALPGPPGDIAPGWSVLDVGVLWASGLRQELTEGDVVLIDHQRFPGWGGAGWPVHAPLVPA